jgi:hypothetical protein
VDPEVAGSIPVIHPKPWSSSFLGLFFNLGHFLANECLTDLVGQGCRAVKKSCPFRTHPTDDANYRTAWLTSSRGGWHERDYSLHPLWWSRRSGRPELGASSGSAATSRSGFGGVADSAATTATGRRSPRPPDAGRTIRARRRAAGRADSRSPDVQRARAPRVGSSALIRTVRHSPTVLRGTARASQQRQRNRLL